VVLLPLTNLCLNLGGDGGGVGDGLPGGKGEGGEGGGREGRGGRDRGRERKRKKEDGRQAWRNIIGKISEMPRKPVLPPSFPPFLPSSLLSSLPTSLARTFMKFERFIFGSGGGIKPAGTTRGWVGWGRKGGGGGRKGRWSVFGHHKDTDSLSLFVSFLSFSPP